VYLKAFLSTVCLLALVILSAPLSVATTIYDNGLPSTLNGYSVLGSSATADDFTLLGDSTIQSVGFYFQNYQGITGWNQDINYSIRANASGAPAASLASGAGMNLVAVDSGLPWCCAGGNAWLVTFDLATPFNATGGVTYWLELSGATGSESAWWVTANLNSTALGRHGTAGGALTLTEYQFAFYLDDAASGPTQIPEPASIGLVGAGGLALMFLSRRRK